MLEHFINITMAIISIGIVVLTDINQFRDRRKKFWKSLKPNGKLLILSSSVLFLLSLTSIYLTNVKNNSQATNEKKLIEASANIQNELNRVLAENDSLQLQIRKLMGKITGGESFPELLLPYDGQDKIPLYASLCSKCIHGMFDVNITIYKSNVSSELGDSLALINKLPYDISRSEMLNKNIPELSKEIAVPIGFLQYPTKNIDYYKIIIHARNGNFGGSLKVKKDGKIYTHDLMIFNKLNEGELISNLG